MATTIEMIEMMQANAEKARAAAKDGTRAFVGNSIVLLAEGQRALVRPVYNMSEAVVIPMHDKYKNTDTSLSSREDKTRGIVPAPISAMCAVHQGKACLFCAQPKEAKLEARHECFVPVYLYGIKDVQDNAVMYTDPDGNEKPVKGFRMLRLKQGSTILAQLMSVYKDQDYEKNVTGCDFLIERKGSGLDTTYSCTPKPPKPMNANLKAAIPAREKFEEILAEIYEPKIVVRPTVSTSGFSDDPLAGLPPVVITPVQQAPVYLRETQEQKVAASMAQSKADEDFTF